MMFVHIENRGMKIRDDASRQKKGMEVRHTGEEENMSSTATKINGTCSGTLNGFY